MLTEAFATWLPSFVAPGHLLNDFSVCFLGLNLVCETHEDFLLLGCGTPSSNIYFCLRHVETLKLSCLGEIQGHCLCQKGAFRCLIFLFIEETDLEVWSMEARSQFRLQCLNGQPKKYKKSSFMNIFSSDLIGGNQVRVIILTLNNSQFSSGVSEKRLDSANSSNQYLNKTSTRQPAAVVDWWVNSKLNLQ
ncbi:hypothetical protein Leryth_016582, partial [Lithospermum erythrorhizon]